MRFITLDHKLHVDYQNTLSKAFDIFALNVCHQEFELLFFVIGNYLIRICFVFRVSDLNRCASGLAPFQGTS